MIEYESIEKVKAKIEQGISPVQQARDLGITRQAFYFHYQKLGYRPRALSRERIKYPEAKQVQSLLDKGMQFYKVCETLGISPSATIQHFKKQGIKFNIVKHKEFKNNYPEINHLIMHFDKGMRLKDLAKFYDIPYSSLVRYLKQYYPELYFKKLVRKPL